MADYYGDVGGHKHFFIGVVKDTNDPKASNRARVRIKGIHPEEDGTTSSGATPSTDSSGSASGGSTGGSSGSASSGSPTTPSGPTQAPIKVDDSEVPNPTQFSAKLSPNFSLGSLIVGADNRRAAANGKLTKEHVKNLKTLAVNCLEPLKRQYPGMIITSGWRAPGPAKAGHSPVNHPGGYAADFQVRGHSPEAIGAWVRSNMKGRFTKFEIATRHNHIQIGGGGSLANPIIFRGKSY